MFRADSSRSPIYLCLEPVDFLTYYIYSLVGTAAIYYYVLEVWVALFQYRLYGLL